MRSKTTSPLRHYSNRVALSQFVFKSFFSPSIKYSKKYVLARQFAAALVECERLLEFRIDFLQLIWNIENKIEIGTEMSIKMRMYEERLAASIICVYLAILCHFSGVNHIQNI